MYIDFKKFSYPNPLSESDKLKIKRDKKFTQDSYISWFNENSEQFITRLWEIDDIGFIEKTGAFIKLLKEAEFTYSLGAYLSAIALIGICAEDLCRFFSSEKHQSMENLSQFERIEKLKSIKFINEHLASDFHEIRKLRNDCLHFNHGFKSKPEDELKKDALQAINKLKKIYKQILGQNDEKFDLEKYNKSLLGIINTQPITGIPSDGMRSLAIRNLLHEATGIDISINEGNKYVTHEGFFKVLDVDIEFTSPELTLQIENCPAYTVIDLNKNDIKTITDQKISENDYIYAVIYSKTTGLGATEIWNFLTPPIRM